MAAVLACGPDCVLSHDSAAALWGIRPARVDEIEVSVPDSVARSRAGIVCHRRAAFGKLDVTRRDGIPVTSPVCMLVDIAPRLERGQLEAAINEADRLDLISPHGLRSALDHLPRRPGLGVLRRTLDRRTFRLTDSALERRFLVLVRRARLPLPRDWSLRQRIQGRLLLAGAGIGRRNRRTPLPPNARRAGTGSPPRPGARCSGPDLTAIYPLPSSLRATLRPGHVGGGRAPLGPMRVAEWRFAEGLCPQWGTQSFTERGDAAEEGDDLLRAGLRFVVP